MGTEIQKSKQLFHEFNGNRFSLIKPVCDIKSSIEHNSKLEFDLFIATRPKSGTTLVSNIVHLIVNNGIPGGSGYAYKFYEYHKYTDTYKDTLQIMATLLPISALPQTNNNTKFIFVLRNPKDVVVSYYHMVKDWSIFDYKGDFHQLFKLWLNGEVVSGDYFDHILEWLPYKNDPKFLFVIYENLIRNKREEIVRIAGFIDDKYRQKLMANDYDNTYMDNVLKFSSIENMKKQITDFPALMRKGIIGDWKNYLNKDESDIIDQKVKEKLNGTELYEIWKNDMLWENK